MIRYKDELITPKVIKRVINIFELYGSQGHINLLENSGLYMLWHTITAVERDNRDRFGIRLTSPLQDLVDDIFLKYLRTSLITGELPRSHPDK